MSLVYKGSVSELRAAATALTGALVASSELACHNDSFVTLSITYAQGGGGTGLVLVPEVSPVSSGDDWQPAESALDGSAVPAAGVVTVPAHETRYTMAQSCSRTLHFRVFGASRFRVRVLETGVAPFGTCHVRAVASRVGG